MLLSFTIANFRSFQDEQTLNLMASKRLGKTDRSPHCREIAKTGEYGLRIASLYGANGAGKSNLVQALLLIQKLVLNGTPIGEPIPYQPFLLDDESATSPSFFELQFMENGSVFRYGFYCDSELVSAEWLDIYEGTQERKIFTRSYDLKHDSKKDVIVELGPAARGKNRTKKLRLLAQVGARPNQLFLSEIFNLDDSEAQGPYLCDVIKWFSHTLKIIQPETKCKPLAEAIAADENFVDFASHFLRDSNTGIEKLDVNTELMKRSATPPDLWDKISGRLAEGERSSISLDRGKELLLNRTQPDTIEIHSIETTHKSASGRAVLFPLQEESDGSKRLLNLLPTLHNMTKQGGVYVIDELERSMHPMLARKFVEFFLKAVPEAKNQLIFTTHESTLLDLDLVRRDGIWFAEKNQKGATSLYSLADFKPRKDLKIDKGYLAGRFGAIPFLSGIDHLIEEQVSEGAGT